MPKGELQSYLDQLPEIMEILSGGNFKFRESDDDED